MTQHVIREMDFLFLYQILLPLCDTFHSVIREDKRILYYYEVDKWSNIYNNQIGIGGSYGNGFRTVKLSETVFCDGIILRNVVWDGTYGTIYCLWQMGADYDDGITQRINC